MADVTLGDSSLATPVGVGHPGAPAEPSPRWELLGRCRRDRTVIAGALIVGLIAGAALAAPLVAPHDPNAIDALSGSSSTAKITAGWRSSRRSACSISGF